MSSAFTHIGIVISVFDTCNIVCETLQDIKDKTNGNWVVNDVAERLLKEDYSADHLPSIFATDSSVSTYILGLGVLKGAVALDIQRYYRKHTASDKSGSISINNGMILCSFYYLYSVLYNILQIMIV